MLSLRQPALIGDHIRRRILPEGMTVTEAAERLGVTRVALSNLLNGKASLSRPMALRLKAAFGADEEDLLGRQEESLHERRREEERKIAVRSYVPPFLRISSAEIHEWADRGEEARSRLPVLLRRLIRSTGSELRRVDFPGYGEAQRPGWDGWVEAQRGSQRIPEGKSGWELSTAQDPGAKADRDFNGPRSALLEHVRAETTFVFVSSRKWPGKRDWEEARKAEGRWKGVWALDADNLEQWLEESIEGQVWLAEELDLPSLRDCMTLNRAWQEWSEAGEPPMTNALFAPAVGEHRAKVVSWLERGTWDRPLLVAADSMGEALAFLSCLFRDENVPQEWADRAVVVNSAQTLKLLAPSTSRFTPIVAGKEAERELAALYRRRPCIVVRPRNAVDQEPDVHLGLLRYDTFRKALLAMGLQRDRIHQLARVSGRSPTVLRRRLSEISAIREPWWAETVGVARKLVPMVLIGAWHAESKADQAVLSLLAGRQFRQLDEDVMAFLGSDDCPVWSVGQHRGVVSKFDGLFALSRYMTPEDLRDFFQLAQMVLSETDPALELRRDRRWAADIYGKVRDCSSALRTGVCETLVLLSVHGNDLFQGELGLNIEGQVAALVRRLLKLDGDESPLTVETLESYDRDLPMLAEAAPDEFLDLLETDLRRPDPAVRELLRPVETSVFAGCPRAGLLWALECLAWSPSNLPRVVATLAKLSTTKIDDNYVHKPINSLRAIFQSWAPQTAATLCQRIQILKKLGIQVPDVGWRVCMNQIGDRTRDDSYRPRWRSDAAGAGQLATPDEMRESVRAGLDLVLAWRDGYNASRLGDLIDHLNMMPEADRERIWSLVEDWLAARRGDRERAELRERLRRFGYATARSSTRVTAAMRQRAKAIYDRLAPGGNAWLFAERWIHDWPDDAADAMDFSGRSERIEQRRREAMVEIWSRDGLSGALALLPAGSVLDVVGQHAARCVTELADKAEVLRCCLFGDVPAELGVDDAKVIGFLQGFILTIGDDARRALLPLLADELRPDQTTRLLLSAPFAQSTWQLAAAQEPDVRRRYWAKVQVPLIGRFSEAECVELVDGLLEAARPFAAFNLVSMDWDAVETSRLIRLLRAMTSAREKDASVEQGMFSFHISNALESLDGRTGVARDELADLEFGFSEILEHEERGIPNVERRVAESPSYFVWLIARAYLRTDGRDDPDGWPAPDSEAGRGLYRLAHSVLGKIARIPGTDADGTIDVDELNGWIAEVRQLGAQFGRVERADICVGELLARRFPEGDRAWPERPICEALEAVGTDRIASGFRTGAINARRVRMRDSVGGETDKDLALKYRTWAEAHAVEYTFVSRVLRSVAGFYDGMAAHWDSDEELQRRLRS